MRNDPKAAAEYDGPHEGVPPWLKAPLFQWIAHKLSNMPEAEQHRLGARLRQDFGNRRALTVVMSDPVVALDVADYFCQTGPNTAGTLERILADAGSAWRAFDGGLERRIDETTTAAARKQMEHSDDVSRLLREAWGACYGRSPDASKAYSKAVKAVETAAHPVIEPNNTKATLGTMIGALKGNASKWQVKLKPETDDRLDLVRGMCELLWHGQRDRHGSQNNTPVLQSDAESAVLLAVTLVAFFRGGVIAVK